MDNLNNNRFGLLSVDDEGNAAVMTPKVSIVAGVNRASEGNVKKTEKENKSGILNKNNASLKTVTKVGRNATIVKALAASQDACNNLGDNNWPDYSIELPKRQGKDREAKASSARYRKKEKGGGGSGRRQFDRQSGSNKTGVKAVDKRAGGGARNWGSVKQDIEDLKAGAMDKEESGNEAAGGEPAVDEAKQMGLDEWMALKKQRPKPNYNLRKAGEGEHNAKWEKMIALAKKTQLNAGKELEYDPFMYPQRAGRLQRVTDIELKFTDDRK
ncbi:hypothetical protein KR044_001400, partial [Drosophila immigrans]